MRIIWSLFFVVSVLAVSEYVSTPHGSRLKQCVMNFPQGTIVEEVATGLKVEYSNGTTKIFPTPDECHADMARLMKEREARRANLSDTPNAWLDNAGWYPPSRSMSRFTGTYTVPGTPSQAGDTLYYFIGMQNNGGGPVNILQPVLAYRGRWTYASWICCPSNISTTGNTVYVSAGETLTATIDRVDGSTWDVSGSGRQGGTDLRQRVGSYRYDWADVTMEQYSYRSCAQSPKGPITFDNMKIYDDNGQQITPRWSGTGRTMCNGVLTIYSPSKITIEHSSYSEDN